MVDETPALASGSWQPYQESISYTFRDDDPNKEHDLYIYVKDDSGNIKGARINGLKIR